jgi:hypothetical protein
VALAWTDVGRGLLPLIWETRALSPQYRQSLLGVFLIFGFSSHVEILKSGPPCCKSFGKPSLTSRGIIISRWRIVEIKESIVLCFYEQ